MSLSCSLSSISSRIPVDLGHSMKFSELVRLLEQNGFKIIKEKGSIRYYSKAGWNNLIRVDYHG